jgi:hypothetical protein
VARTATGSLTDSDGGGIRDDVEVGAGLNPYDPGDDALYDSDGDGISDALDNCPSVANANQENLDDDAQGDACDTDIDGDGLPNDWESSLGLNPDLATDGQGDLDGDGATNAQEYRAGTDATDPLDSPAARAQKVIPIIMQLLMD